MWGSRGQAAQCSALEFFTEFKGLPDTELCELGSQVQFLNSPCAALMSG